MKRYPLALAAALIFTGCATKTFENRIVITPDCKRGFVASLYGPIGVTSEVEAADIAAVCQAKKDPSNAAK